MLGRFARSAATLLNRESGPTAVECAVMLAMVAMAFLTAISTLGETTAGF